MAKGNRVKGQIMHNNIWTVNNSETEETFIQVIVFYIEEKKMSDY